MTTAAELAITNNMEMVEQQEESIDVPKTINLPTETDIAVVEEPDTTKHQIAKNNFKLMTMQQT
jgi:hypothetical protein